MPPPGDKGKRKAVDPLPSEVREAPRPPAHDSADYSDVTRQWKNYQNDGHNPRYPENLMQAGGSSQSGPEHTSLSSDQRNTRSQGDDIMRIDNLAERRIGIHDIIHPENKAPDISEEELYSAATQHRHETSSRTGDTSESAPSGETSKWTDTDKKLHGEFQYFTENGQEEKITPEHLRVQAKYMSLYREQNPDYVNKQKENKRQKRALASKMRKYLVRNTPGKDLDTPAEVYQAAQEGGYTRSQKTLERKAERYAQDSKNYQSSDEESSTERNPDHANKQKENKRQKRTLASRMRKYLVRNMSGKDLDTPTKVYQAAQEGGYTRSQKTLERKAERHDQDPKNYQSSDEESSGEE